MTGDVGKYMVFSADIKNSSFHLLLYLLTIYSEVQRYPKIFPILAMNVQGGAYVLEAVAENPVF